MDDFKRAIVVPSPLIRVQLDLRLDFGANGRLVVTIDNTSAVVGAADVVAKVRARVNVLLVPVAVGDALREEGKLEKVKI